MKRVVLLNPPAKDLQIRDLYCSISSKADYCWPPIDLLFASAFLKGGFELAVVDAMAEGLSARLTAERVKAFGPAALVSMTGSSTWPGDMALLRELKEASGCRVVVSGDVCLDRDRWLLTEFPWLDALWTDFTSSSLAGYLQEGRSSGHGLAYRDGAGVVDLPKDPGKSFSIPVPAHELFPLRSYRLPYAAGHPLSTVLTNFGCPFSCGYCIQNKNVMGYRSRPVANVVEELERLRDLGVREVYFRDPLFESHKANALALCRAMTQRGFGFTWSCNSRVDTVEDGLLAAMREAGCRLIAFGFETANEAILKSYGKAGLATARAAIGLCRARGIRVAGYFILGLPGETYATVEDTIRFAVDSGIDYASFSLPTPDYGTTLRRDAIEAGLIGAGHRTFDRSDVGVSLTGALSPVELKTLQEEAVRRFYFRPGHILRLAAGIRSVRQLGRTLASGGAVLRRYLALRRSAAAGA